MKCSELIIYGPGGDCEKPAKWWVQDGPKRPWVPRCGRHALMPPFTTRKRVAITEPKPEWPAEPAAEGGLLRLCGIHHDPQADCPMCYPQSSQGGG